MTPKNKDIFSIDNLCDGDVLVSPWGSQIEIREIGLYGFRYRFPDDSQGVVNLMACYRFRDYFGGWTVDLTQSKYRDYQDRNKWKMLFFDRIRNRVE